MLTDQFEKLRPTREGKSGAACTAVVRIRPDEPDEKAKGRPRSNRQRNKKKIREAEASEAAASHVTAAVRHHCTTCRRSPESASQQQAAGLSDLCQLLFLSAVHMLLASYFVPPL